MISQKRPNSISKGPSSPRTFRLHKITWRLERCSGSLQRSTGLAIIITLSLCFISGPQCLKSSLRQIKWFNRHIAKYSSGVFAANFSMTQKSTRSRRAQSADLCLIHVHVIADLGDPVLIRLGRFPKFNGTFLSRDTTLIKFS